MSELAPNPNMNAVLIGGGKLDEDPTLLDRGLELSGAEKPNVLMIPTAKATQLAHDSYVQRIGDTYSSLGATTDLLHDFTLGEPDSLGNQPADLSKMPSREEMLNKFGNADVIFTFGGNTRKMIHDVWIPTGIVEMLDEQINNGTVVSGISAGAIAPFAGGHSDWQEYETNRGFDNSIPTSQPDLEKGWNYDYVEGLGYIPSHIAIPHYDKSTADGEPREDSSHRMLSELSKNGEVKGIGIDNYAALEIIAGGLARAVPSAFAEGRKSVYSLVAHNGHVSRSQIESTQDHRPLAELIALN